MYKIENNILYYKNNPILKIDRECLFNEIQNIVLPIPEADGKKDWYAVQKYSVLEQDRPTDKTEFKTKKTVSVPVFVLPFWELFSQNKTVPSFTNYAIKYIEDNLVETNKIIDTGYMYKNNKNIALSYIGKEYTFTESNQVTIFKNRLYQYKANNNLTVNQITTLEVLRRLYKAYPSYIRDLYHTVAYGALGYNAVYSLKNDLKGTDLIVNNVHIGQISNTAAAKHFYNVKESERGAYKNKLQLGTNINMSGNSIDLLTDAELITLYKSKLR